MSPRPGLPGAARANMRRMPRSRPVPTRPAALALGGLLVAAGACTPVLDWRVVRPGEAGVEVLMPCKPERAERPVSFPGGPPAPMELRACDAGGSTWAVSTAALGDPARVPAALALLRAARQASSAGTEQSPPRDYRPRAAAPLPGSLRFEVRGHRPDGREVLERAGVFAVGDRVFHLAVLDGSPSADALERFFDHVVIAAR